MEIQTDHNLNNLAILCLECHDDTQIQGGFSRKLDSDQIKLYRDDWHRLVAQQRAITDPIIINPENKDQIEYITSIADIYKENSDYDELAMLYDGINNELRDKYIELALENNPSDASIIYFRSLQDKIELIPDEVIKRELKRKTKDKDFLQRARVHHELKNYEQAAIDYIDGIHEVIHNKEFIFTAAFILKNFLKKD